MCPDCELDYLDPYTVKPTCWKCYYAGPITINVFYNTMYDETTVELCAVNDPLKSMTYRLSTHLLHDISTEELVNVLCAAFKPFFEWYPHAEEILATYIRKEHKPKPQIATYDYTNYNVYDKLYSKYATGGYVNDGYTQDYSVNPATEIYYNHQKAWGEFEKNNPDTAKHYVGEPKFQLHDYSVNVPGGRRPEVDKLPGLKQMVKYPGRYGTLNVDGTEDFTMTLERAIIRLNDKDRWTREQIADWLETLDVDITFRSENADQV